MPPAFPSHQGLLVPLWRRFPERFNILSLYVGAAVPDAVDGAAGIVRGGLGQWYGHTLIGSFGLCIPAGLALTWCCLRIGRCLAPTRWGGRVGRGLVASYSFPYGCSRKRRGVLLAWSVWAGAFSHIIIDLVTHKNMILLRPWFESDRFFPEWWRRQWFEIWLPGYENPYPAGWHLAAWLALGTLGALMFLRSIGLTGPRAKL